MFRKTGRGKSTGAANGNDNAGGSVSVKEEKNDDNNDNDNNTPPPSSTTTTTNGNQQQPYRHDETLIYSTPTVDTLNDESGALSRFYLSPQNNPNNNVTKSSTTMYLTQDDNINNNNDMISTTTRDSLSMPSINNNNNNNNNNNTSTVKVAATHKVGINHSGRRLLEESGGHKKNNNNNNNNSRKKSKKELQQEQRRRIHIQYQQQKQLRRQQLRAKNNGNNKSSNSNNKEFQLEDDAMSVTVRRVCVAERTAFDKKLPPYLVTFGGGSDDGSNNNNSSRKISPSLQHWRVLQQLSSVTHVRQLAFSHSVGSAVDVFWREELEEEEEEDNNNRNNNLRRDNNETWGNNNDNNNNVDSNRKKNPRRDGRYRSIDPVRATTAALPKDPPLLSNKKHRLPMRTDVGFSNASAEEISQKQEEIRCETQWEEASPRLVVLVTGDDLGRAVEEDIDDDYDENNNDNVRRRSRKRGLPGMPYAGKDLIRAKERNNRHFSRRQEQSSSSLSSSSRYDEVERATNMLAPPLDAIYSGTLGWRPRPFHDRPPGLRYTLVSPLVVDFSVGKMEPLVCSLALYSLIKGKLSEEFYFPAGDWRGKLQLDALQDQSRKHQNKDVNTNIDKNGEDMGLLTQLWNQRKHKAIFAHSSLTGNGENDDDLYVVLQVYKVTHKDSIKAYWAKGGNNSSDSYDITSSSSSDRKTWRKKLKNKLFQKDSKKQSKSDTTVTVDETDIEKALLRSNVTFEAYGTQFMSPLCFGITSLFPEDSHASSRNNTWPRGQVQQGMNLYAFPNHSESQEDFLRRLRKVVYPTIQPVGIDDTTEASGSLKSLSNLSGVTRGISGRGGGGGGDDQSVGSASQFPDSSSVEFTSPLKRKGSVRRFMTPRRMSKRDLGSPNPKMSSSVSLPSSMATDKAIEDTPLIPGSATLFTSNLDVDFLQSMLVTPPELKDRISVKTSGSSQSKAGGGKGDSDQSRELVLPRILVDVSGDSAIMIDPKKTNTGTPSASSAKRSDLVRLPSTRLAEHMDSSEFREVLFLSPEPDKSLEYDHRSMLNLLYLYPRLLVLKSKDDSTIGGEVGKPSSKQRECPMRYTVRIRLIQSLSSANENGVIGSHIEINTSFHNPASWGGSNLLRSVFTRIPTENSDPSFTPKGQPIDDPRAGIPLRDEFKMNLPTILDGRHYLQFSLFSVELNDYADEPSSAANVESCSTSSGEEDCRISLRQIAETTIPLSSSSTRDLKSGVKATTVIPNGCHRLRLGDFQLQVETRLVSSIHVSDPAVAAVLRGFPVASIDGQIGNRGNANNLEEMAITRVGRSTSSRGSDTFPEKVSYSSLLSTASESAMAGHFQSLFFLHVRNLTKTTSGQDIETSEKFIMDNMLSLLVLFQRVKSFKSRVDVFIKSTVDSFDEPSNYGITQGEATEDDSASDFFAEPKHKSSSIELDFVEEGEEEKFDGGAIRRRKRHSVSSDIDIRLSRTYSAIESSEVPFSRVAYGASKTDHMRLEAEMGGDHGRVTTLFDDDETVVTLTTTRHAEAQLIEARNTFEKTKMTSSSQGKPLNKSQSPSFNSLEHAENQSKDPKEIGFAAYQHSMSELNLGKRMKSAAQVMLAPCVTVTPGLAAFLCRPTSRSASSTLENSETKQDLTVSNSTKPNIEPIMEDVFHQIPLPGSDLDDDDSILEKEDIDTSPYHTIYGIFRGPRNCKKLEFSIQRDNVNERRIHKIVRGLYVYESIMVLWLQAWEDYVSTIHQNASNVINFLGEKDNDFAMFHLQIDILLPILLKSICLRYEQVTKNSKQKPIRCILDKDHVHVFESFVEMLAIGLMGQAMAELQQQTEHGTLDDAIDACDHVVDFLIGLFAIFHPAHMKTIISKFIMTLRSCETDHDGSNESIPFEWNETSLHRTKCSRQLRLRIVEKLAVLPNFVALNFPQRYSSKHFSSAAKQSSWTMQYGIDTSPNEYQDGSEDNSIGDGLIPRNGWLASILTNESLSMCALSCEAVVVEAIANIKTQDSRNNNTPLQSSLKRRPTVFLKRSDLLMFQSIAIHAISCVYELLLRRHAMDRRFQKESSRGRIAALFTKPIFEKSLASVRWLARMESTHKVRSIWLLCFVYILQESPEGLIREYIRSYSNPSDLRIHRFIRLLRLGSSTFQSFVDQQRHCMFPLEIDKGISPWLLQESFNTLCATTILVVEECVNSTSSVPDEQRKMIQGILDLLLHVLTTPQSTVTHLRAVGGAIQAFEKFGTQMFLDTTGVHFQHWIRIIIGLMNSVALSVRSIAVDFVVSLLCGVFDLHGNIDDVVLIFATVLPEVVAREIALCSVSGLITSFEEAEKSIWPLRRSFADIEDANPLDDDRVDPQLSPILSVFCRASQAIIDGVLIEMRLRGDDCIVVGTRISPQKKENYAFDADEESLFEAANYFAPETAPMQRLRWLLTLKSLHEAKGHWVEAAESLIMCAMTVSDAIPHLKNAWRPTRFSLWSDGRRSLWLSTVGEAMGNPEQGNTQVMTFANSFLEPELIATPNEESNSLKLPQLNLESMCSLLTSVSKEAVYMYGREGGMDDLAYTRLESLLKIVMGVFDGYEIACKNTTTRGDRLHTILQRKQYVEEVACLRKVMASITGDMTKVAERLLLVVQDAPISSKSLKSKSEIPQRGEDQPYYVRLLLSGRKPRRFEESTTLPTFLEWDNPCICRVPKDVVQQASQSVPKNSDISETAICNAFSKRIRNALLEDLDSTAIVFGTGITKPDIIDPDITYIDIGLVHADAFDSRRGIKDGFGHEYRRFRYCKPNDAHDGATTTYVEMTVAIAFPCPLSRQRSMLTNEFVSSKFSME
jgi:hypothetical protein